MRVLISWSGEHSERVAGILRDWLPMVIQSIDPWVSSEDIAKGDRWTVELDEALRESGFGIVCINAQNAHEPWINFEAGAMSNSLQSSRVSPLLMGIGPEQLPGTLAQFQCTQAERKDVRRLVGSINECLEKPVSKDRIDAAFDLAWPRLEGQLETIELPEEIPEEAGAPASGGLPDDQIKILILLGKVGNNRPNANEIARAINENLTRTKYHLDKLKARGLVHPLLSALEPARYVLTEGGRAFLVEKNLI